MEARYHRSFGDRVSPELEVQDVAGLKTLKNGSGTKDADGGWPQMFAKN